jgi:hypothetical protein
MQRYILNEKKAAALILECSRFSLGTRISELDCNKSWSRYDSTKSLADVLKIAKKSKFTHYFFQEKTDLYTNETYLDIGLKTTVKQSDISLYVFIRVHFNKLEYLMKKYDIRKE